MQAWDTNVILEGARGVFDIVLVLPHGIHREIPNDVIIMEMFFITTNALAVVIDLLFLN